MSGSYKRAWRVGFMLLLLHASLGRLKSMKSTRQQQHTASCHTDLNMLSETAAGRPHKSMPSQLANG